jgi:hypothetical protein
MTRNRRWNDRPAQGTRRPADWRDAADAAFVRRQTEIRETAKTLVEDRGWSNALEWSEHCMTRDPVGGFWRAVHDAIWELEP